MCCRRMLGTNDAAVTLEGFNECLNILPTVLSVNVRYRKMLMWLRIKDCATPLHFCRTVRAFTPVQLSTTRALFGLSLSVCPFSVESFLEHDCRQKAINLKQTHCVTL